MKNKIKNFLKYLLKEYPHKSELSASRLTKMLYLADWKNALENGTQMTDTTWHFNHYGPYVDDFIEIAEIDKDIEIVDDITIFGGRKRLVKLLENDQLDLNINPQEKQILDFVIDKTKSKNYEDFITLVYSTYPVISNTKYSDLDLVELAKQYKKLLQT